MFSYRAVVAIGLALLSGSALAALFAGDVAISPAEIAQMLRTALLRGEWQGSLELKYQILLQLRLPRIGMALVAGAALSVSGAVFQAAFRNPLVSPDILGVTAGSSLGALGLLLIYPLAAAWLIAAASFSGGMLAVFVVLLLARKMAAQETLSMVLLGIVLASLFNALLVALKSLFDPLQKLPAVMFWTLGSLNRANWEGLLFLLGAFLLGAGLLYRLRFRLNLISIGDCDGHALGFKAAFMRKWLLVLASFMVASVVSVCGQIGWLALVTPHLARALVGPDHLKMLPISLLLGAILLLWADILAHILTVNELPVSVMTSLLGAPLFVWLLFRQRGLGWQ